LPGDIETVVLIGCGYCTSAGVTVAPPVAILAEATAMATPVTRANLPVQLTSFIGRQRELSDAQRLLERTRLLTLTGPGGSGKTRLSLHLATLAAPAFPDGVYFVPLAPIRDAELVLSSIAQIIGLQDSRERPLIEHLTSYLHEKSTLLILDNFEQLLPAAPLVAELLRETTDLKLVVTSRACLRLSGEQEFSVPPLALPDASGSNLQWIMETESTRLFVERARAVLPGFVTDASNAQSLCQIVSRLDGLPLAIELAAARVKLFSPQAMLPRLEHSLGLLVAGPRDLPDRQQTLRATIAWSYGLLTSGAQRLLAVCSVFRGSASLERIESTVQAAGGIGTELLCSLAELVDHSMLRRLDIPGSPRFAMLETIREYAAERLAEIPEEKRILADHASAFLAFAETGERDLAGPAELEWLHLLDLEHNNLRAAVDWYAHESPDRALRLGVALRPFWSARGHFTEGRQRLATLLARAPEASVTRVRALIAEAWLAVDQGDYVDAASRLEESIALSRHLGDKQSEGMAIVHFGRCKIASGFPAQAVQYLEEAIPILRATAEPPDLAVGLLYWGLCAIFTDQPRAASERLGQAAQMCRQIGFESLGARALLLLSYARIDLEDLGGARAALEEALPTSMRFADHWVIAQQIGAFGALAAKSGRPRLALRLAGFSSAFSQHHDFSVPYVARQRLDYWLAPARRALGTAADRAFVEGQQLSLEEAAGAALALDSGSSSRSTPGSALTQREMEVARLVAQGFTNREVADQLSLSVRTVEVHVDHILTKLAFNTRTQLARWAVESEIVDQHT
jgi:non-specific serine/threonine protein kinase